MTADAERMSGEILALAAKCVVLRALWTFGDRRFCC